jgi:hypothetical protein
VFENGALKTCEPPQLFVIVKVPVPGGLVMDKVPETPYVFVAGLQALGIAVNPVTPQTKEQSAEPLPPVCEKEMVPAVFEKLVNNNM